MNPRRILTTALLAFVGLSFCFVAIRSVKAARAWRAPVVAQAPPEEPANGARKSGKVVAYYFHVTVRCTTCQAIESYSAEVIRGRLAAELKAGRLEWRLVNVQLPENRHFIQDFQLFTRSLVLVHEVNGSRREFKVLNDTWELVGDKTAMQKYVETEVRAYLRKLG